MVQEQVDAGGGTRKLTTERIVPIQLHQRGNTTKQAMRRADGQPARLVYYQSEMSTLWPPELSCLSRGVVFHPSMLSMPTEIH